LKHILQQTYRLPVRLGCIFTAFLIFSGCTLLPGMQNPSTAKMQLQTMHYSSPFIIPITESLLYSMASHYFYRIGYQDTLNVAIWQHPEFDRPIQQQFSQTAPTSNTLAGQFNYSVNSNGAIYFPLIGYVSVAGQTIDHVRNELTRRLKVYIRNPQVNISIAEYRSQKIYVLGEVNKPGVLYLNNEPMSIMDALMLSSSIDSNTGDPRFIYVVRGGVNYPIIYWLNANTPDRLILAENFRLQANDIVYVSAAVVTRWNRFLSQLLPTIQTVWFTKAITRR
jgi:hypothetical protein